MTTKTNMCKVEEKKVLGYRWSTKETAYVTARLAGMPASLKNWIHSDVAEKKEGTAAKQCEVTQKEA